jgi:hypothetical protein
MTLIFRSLRVASVRSLGRVSLMHYGSVKVEAETALIMTCNVPRSTSRQGQKKKAQNNYLFLHFYCGDK